MAAERLLWTTFTSEQIDIDVRSSAGQAYLERILSQFQAAGIRVIRLDAVGYAIKKPGTSCFMIPETFDFIAELTAQAHALGIEVLVEIHTTIRIRSRSRSRSTGFTTSRCRRWCCTRCTRATPRALKHWLAISPRNAVTVLDTHDGIGVIDVGPVRKGTEILPGLLTSEEIDDLVETIHAAKQRREPPGNRSRRRTTWICTQVNCTFYDALGPARRRIPDRPRPSVLRPGVPQVYYVGLLAGANDLDLLRRTGVGRDINRHYYSRAEIEAELARPVVRSLLDLIRFRNTHPAFAGEFHLLPMRDHEISIEWRNGGSAMGSAWLDLKAIERARSRTPIPAGNRRFAVVAGAARRLSDE